jgi:tRNA-specific 2-thiouridylase
MSKERVIVAMSGGVDSSVAALLLKKEGYEVIGVTMRLWTTKNTDQRKTHKGCCSIEDVDDARRVCQIIDTPHYFLNFEREFQEHVVSYFIKEYDNGRTPHPCLACNDKIKFDFLLRKASFLDADYIATGHYARIENGGNSLTLLKGIDQNKDQSYVLFTLNQSEMKRLLLPVGNYPKDYIRKMALDAGLPVADKPDSQEICFIPDGDYRKFVREQSKPKPGQIVSLNGDVLGNHPGIQFFTVGQRRKLGLKGHSESPMYVTKINTERNEIVLGSEKDLYSSTLWASNVNYLSDNTPSESFRATAKIRYKASEMPANINPLDNWAEIRFDEPQRAVTPGQAVVFYDNEKVIGGGFIEIEKPDIKRPTDENMLKV